MTGCGHQRSAPKGQWRHPPWLPKCPIRLALSNLWTAEVSAPQRSHGRGKMATHGRPTAHRREADLSTLCGPSSCSGLPPSRHTCPSHPAWKQRVRMSEQLLTRQGRLRSGTGRNTALQYCCRTQDRDMRSIAKAKLPGVTERASWGACKLGGCNTHHAGAATAGAHPAKASLQDAGSRGRHAGGQ